MIAPARPVARRDTLLVLAALSAFGPLALDLYLPALPDLGRDLRASTSVAQLSLTACLLGLGVGQILAGPFSDAVGRRRPMLAALGLFTVASLLCAVAPSLAVLLPLRFLQGIAGGASIVIARATVRDLHEGEDAARAYSTLMLIMGVAPIAAPVLGGQLVRFTDWRGVFATLAVAGVLLAAVAAWRLPEGRPAAVRAQDEPHERGATAGLRRTLATYAMLLADRRVRLPVLVFALVASGLFTYVSGSSFVLQRIYGFSPQAFSLAFAGGGVGIVVMNRVNRSLLGRAAPGTLLLAGAATLASGGAILLVAVLAGAPVGFVVAGFLVGVSSVGLVFPNATTLALADHPRHAGAAGALLGFLQFAFGAAAAPLAGIAGEATAIPTALVMTVGGTLGALVAVRARRAHVHSSPRSRRSPGTA